MKKIISHVKQSVQQTIELAEEFFNSAQQSISKLQAGIQAEIENRLPQLAMATLPIVDRSQFRPEPVHQFARRQTSQAANTDQEEKEVDTSPPSPKQILADKLGADLSALESLDQASLKSLTELVKKGPQAAHLAIKVLNAVHRTSPGREKEAINNLSNYPGSLPILESFLNHIGTEDPFIATDRAQVIVLPINELPADALIADEDLDKQPTRRQKAKHSVRGVSGHIITGMIYCAYNQESPVDSSGFFAKQQGIMRPFETFNPERFTAKKAETVENRRKESHRKIVQSLTLGELEQEPEPTAGLKSPILRRDLEVYRELRQAIEEYKQLYGALLYGDTVVLPAVEGLQVKTDTGGIFLGWFKRQIDSEKPLPSGILAAYQSLTDPNVDLEPETERDYIRGLLAYQRIHSYMNKQVALAGIVSDIKEYENLPQNDSLRLNEKLDKAKRTVQELAASSDSELKVSDFGSLLDIGGLADFRVEANKRLLEHYQEEYTKTLNSLGFLFMEDSRLREDCLQESVPMARLKNSLYGAKIGVDSKRASDEKKRACLTQRDFKAIKDAFFFQIVTSKKEEHLLKSMPVARFRAHLEGVVAAGRKAAYVDQALAGHLAESDTEIINLGDVGTCLKDWKPVLPMGNDLKPAEVLVQKQDPEEGRQVPVKELLTFACDHHIGSTDFRGKLSQLKAQAAAGLYPQNMEEHMLSLIGTVRRFTFKEEIGEQIASAKRILESPFVRPTMSWRRDLLKQNHFSNPDALLVSDYAEFEETFKSLGLGDKEKLADLAESLKKLHFANVYSGGRKGRTLSLKMQGFSEFAGESVLHNLHYHDPKKLSEAIEALGKDYLRADEIGEDWFKKAKHICSSRGRATIKAEKMHLVDDDTFRAVKAVGPYSHCYISREFFEAVNKIEIVEADKTTAPVSRANRIGSSHHFKWAEKEGIKIAVFGFGKYEDRPITEVISELREKASGSEIGYFSRFIQGGKFPEHVKEIAAKIARLADPDVDYFEAAFSSWLNAPERIWKKN